ncbi:MAG: YceI family protein [Hymenobacteraceae bacterium]|nr:YceI family protein [Hymenobacteraceae bacterium]
MKNVISALSLAATLFVAAPVVAADGDKGKGAKPAAETMPVDLVASKVEWIGEKVVGNKHNGVVTLKSGTVEATGGRLTGGTFLIDMTTIKNLDLTDASYNAKLVGHLKSDDFFGVEKHPTATFKITSVGAIKGAEAGKPNYTVNGDLTIKGITNRISFPTTVTTSGAQLTAVGTTKIDRSKYDVKYGSGSFFDNLGDKAISNDMTITFNVVAKK